MTAELSLDAILAALTQRAMVAEESSDKEVLDNGAHHHRAGQLLGSSSGLLSVTTERGTWVLPSTHCIWIPPRQVHAVRSHGPFSGWSLFINEAVALSLSPAAKAMRTAALLRQAIHRLATIELEPKTPRHEHLEQVILDELADLPAEERQLTAPADPRLRRITDAIVADFTLEMGLEEWAAWGGISSRSLSRRFVEETGFTFTTWRQRARMVRATELLAQGQAVSKVSLDLGYANVGAFIALFRRTYGVTPRRYAERIT
jgi:AraC-like DNA-binding protein